MALSENQAGETSQLNKAEKGIGVQQPSCKDFLLSIWPLPCRHIGGTRPRSMRCVAELRNLERMLSLLFAPSIQEAVTGYVLHTDNE